MITEKSTVVAATGIAATRLAGEVILLDLNEGIYFGLNEVGERIWTLIQRPVRVSDVAVQIQAEFAVSAEQCSRDLIELLRAMERHGLARHVREAAGENGRPLHPAASYPA